MPALPLRLFAPEALCPDPVFDLPETAELTLRQWYDLHLLPNRQLTRSRRTLQTDRQSIDRWERFGWSLAKRWEPDRWGRFSPVVLQPQTIIQNPPIGLIVDDDLTRFVATLSSERFAAASIQQTINHLKVIFSAAGPREGRHSRALGVLLRRPAFPLLDDVIQPVWMPRQDDLQKVWSMTFTLPTRWAKFARAMIGLAALFGLRPGDLTRLRWDSNLPRDCSVLHWTPSKTKRHKPYPMVCPIPDWLKPHLRAIRRRNGQRVLPAYKNASRLWRKMVRGCGYRQTTVDRQGRKRLVFSLSKLRKYANANANAIRTGAGNWILGHAVSSGDRINHVHYSDVYQAPAWVVEALSDPRLQQPFVFSG